jgi:hypothetical protein
MQEERPRRRSHARKTRHKPKGGMEKRDKMCGLVFPTAGCRPNLDFLDTLKAVAERVKLDKQNFWLHNSYFRLP